MSLITKKDRTAQRSHDIIQSILDSNKTGVLDALHEDAECINALHLPSKLNAPMLCIVGGLSEFFEIIINHSGHLLDYSHLDSDCEDLQEIAFASLDKALIDLVQEAYELHAKHIINNWPEP